MPKLYTKIRLEIVDADIVIEGADIALDIKKTDEGKPNYCSITIYNVSENTYNILNDKANEIRVYTDTNEQGYVLTFQGVLRDIVKWKKAKSEVKKKRKSKRKTPIKIHYNEPPISRSQDNGNVITTIELQDGFKDTFLNNYYSQSYSGEVTNNQILNDILYFIKRQTTLTIGNIATLQEKTFPKGKVMRGTLNNVLRSICQTGKCKSVIDNNILNVFSNNVQEDVYGYYLHSGICPRPEFNADKEIDVEAPFLPTIEIGNFVKLDFQDIDGIYPIKKIESKIDNFGGESSTKITLKAE